jgi:PAS domain S-box-containing protein
LIRQNIEHRTGDLVAVNDLPFNPEAFEYLIDAIIIVDNKQRITYLNDAAAKLYDLPKEKSLGQKITEIFTVEWSAPQDQETLLLRLNRKTIGLAKTTI